MEFLDIKNKFKIIAKINHIECSEAKNSLLMLNYMILIVMSQSTGIYLIDIKKHNIIKKIMNKIYLHSMIRLLSGNFLVGVSNKLIEYKYEKDDFFEIKSSFIGYGEKYTTNLCKMKDGKIASLVHFHSFS